MANEKLAHRDAVIGRPADHPGQVGRFGNITRMVIHPHDADMDSPNAGTITYPPGTGFPLHKHDFAQVWYLIDGECRYGDRTLKQGDVIYHGDPHVEQEMYTESGCTMLFVQYPGPRTGARPIFERRFDAAADTDKADMDLER